MSHPLIPQIIQLAEAIAIPLELELVDAVLHTHKNPVVLRVDIRNLHQNTGLEDCERMSRNLEEALDQSDIIPFAYVLEVSSPGTDREIKSDREFIAFRGFNVTVTSASVYDGKQNWTGQLVSRDDENLTLNQKGRITILPRPIIMKVELTT